jgi:glycerol-3-phosphate acyltransferase PlsY
MTSLAAPFLLLAAIYLLGSISTGYWLVRFRTGRDIRSHGSGTTGATNAGRVLGRVGFALVFAGDILKGALALFACRFLEFNAPWPQAAAFAVVIGHIWPPQLGFRGGKGISPFLGAWLVFAPLTLAPSLAFALICLIISRRFTLSGLAGLALFPLSVFFILEHDIYSTVFATLSTLVIFYAHRDHLRGKPKQLPL